MMTASFQKEWTFGDFACDVYGALTSFGGCGSIMALTAIAYDRYTMICFAADANRIASKGRSLRIALMVWVYTSMFAILPSLGVGGFIMDGWPNQPHTRASIKLQRSLFFRIPN